MDIRRSVDWWLSSHGYEYWEPLAILARLTEELGEVARAINTLAGPKKIKEGEAKRSLEEELGDMLFTIGVMANKLDINLDEGLRRALQK